MLQIIIHDGIGQENSLILLYQAIFILKNNVLRSYHSFE